MNNKKLYTLDNEGNLRFEKRRQLNKSKHKPDSFWNSSYFLALIIITCVAADYACFSSLFASFLYSNAMLRNICIIAMVIAFEVSPVYFAYNMKRRSCGYSVPTISIFVAFFAFVLGATANIILRLTTHSLVFPDLVNISTSVIGNSEVIESSGSSNSIIYAWFFAVLPIITSMIVFAATYTISNPLLKEFEKLKKENIELTDEITQLEAILAEYEADENHLDRLLTDDHARYNAALLMIQKQRDEYFDFCRQRMAERLGSPAATSYRVEHSVSKF